MPDDYMLSDYPDVGPECGHPGSLAYPAGCKDCRIEELEKQLAKARREAMEEAASVNDRLLAHVLHGMGDAALSDDNQIPLKLMVKVKNHVCDALAKAASEIRALIPQRGDKEST